MTGVELLGLVMLLVMLGAIFIGLPISFTLLFLAFMVPLPYFASVAMSAQPALVATSITNHSRHRAR